MPSFFEAQDVSTFPAPPEVYNWRVYALAVAASMGSAMFGYDSAFIGGSLSLPSFMMRFGLDEDASAGLSANIVSTFQAGCFFGAIFVLWFVEKFGRRPPLLVCGVLFDIGAVLQVASMGQLGLIYAGRILTGLAVGASSLIIPQYISEWAPPAIRGRLIGIFEMVLQISQIIGFWVNYGVQQNISGTSDAQWRIPFALQLVPGTALTIFMLLQPESPRWLIKSGQAAKAVQNLSAIRRLPADHEYIQLEIVMVEHQVRHETELGTNNPIMAKLKEIALPQNRTRLFLGIMLMLLQNLSGINALNYYSTRIFSSVGFSGADVSLLATGIFGVVKCVATVAFMLFGIDKLGRRMSMIIGSTGALLAMYYLGGYTKMSGSFEGNATRDGGAYVAIIMIYIFAIFYAMSWNGIPWIFCAEVFPTGIRSFCLVFTTCTQWLGQFVIAYSTPYMMENITYGTFLFFGSSLVVAVVFVYYFMPETKGFSLEEMDILFGVKGLATKKRREAEEIISRQRVSRGVEGKEKQVQEQVEVV